MRQLRQLLRLRHGARQIGRTLGVGRRTIEDTLERGEWPGSARPRPALNPGVADTSNRIGQHRQVSSSGRAST
jgi:hypothetical protein